MLPGIINENTARIDRIASLDQGHRRRADEARDVEGARRPRATSTTRRSGSRRRRRSSRSHNAKNNIKADDTQVAGAGRQDPGAPPHRGGLPRDEEDRRPPVDRLPLHVRRRRRASRPSAASSRSPRSRATSTRTTPTTSSASSRSRRTTTTPDAVRDVAFRRIGEFPKERIVPKLYTLFDPKKWKVRWVAGETVLKTMSTEAGARVHGPPAEDAGDEDGHDRAALVRRRRSAQDGAGAGEPKPRDVILPYLNSKEFGPKMTALGFFWEGKKADRPVVQPLRRRHRPSFRSARRTTSARGSATSRRRRDSKETEPKELKTVGEFVKFCLVPSMEK